MDIKLDVNWFVIMGEKIRVSRIHPARSFNWSMKCKQAISSPPHMILHAGNYSTVVHIQLAIDLC